MQGIGISKDSPVYLLPVATLVTGMAIIGVWIAVGPGERAFGGSAGFLLFSADRKTDGTIGRIAFGIGAVFTSAITVLIWREFYKRLRDRS